MDGFGHGRVSVLAPACCILFWSKTGGEFGQRRRSAGAAEGTELLQALFVQLSAAADAVLSMREWLREATEAEVSAAALRVLWAMCLAYDAACLPFGMVGELRRKLSPITTLVLLLNLCLWEQE